MIENLLQHLDGFLIVVFSLSAAVSASLMIFLRQPMRVAVALISTMIFLGGVYGLLGVHFIAAFQVLIYVGAVMVFMVYVIMLLEVREALGAVYSKLLWPGLVGFALLVGAMGISLWRGLPSAPPTSAGGSLGISQFAATFLNEYWLHFELTSVLLVAAVVAALAVIRVSRRSAGKAPHG